MKLFTLLNGNIVINKIELLAIPEFKQILKRDRSKDRAFKELLYIYYIADMKSLPNIRGYNDKEKHDYAIRICKLDDGWKPDALIKAAIKIYKEERDNIGRDTINELLKTFRFTGKVMNKVRHSIEELLNVDKLTREQASEILGLIETTIKFGKDIPMLIEHLNSAINKLFEAEKDESVELLRGIKEPVPMSANPETDF